MNSRYVIILMLLGILCSGCTIIDDAPHGETPSEQEEQKISLDMDPEEGNI